MRILTGSRSLTERVGPFAVGLGIFDGVHLGHRALLGRVRKLADSEGIESLAYTFDPHPAVVLVPSEAPQLLEPVHARLEAFAALGLSATMVERFDRTFAAVSPDAFIEEVLADKLHAKHVVVGAGFTFGAKGKGNTDLLIERGKELGFQTHIIDPVMVEGKVVSSTRIRELVNEGNMRDAARLLARPFVLTGSVARGLMRGQTIGFPTANLVVENEIVPATGVYAGFADGPMGRHASVTNIGYTPTFGGSRELKVEAHLLDFESRPLYGSHVTIELIERLRGEQKFTGADALVAQIGRDIDKARSILTR